MQVLPSYLPFPMILDDGTPSDALDTPILYALTEPTHDRLGNPLTGYWKVIPDKNDPRCAVLSPTDGIFPFERHDRDSVTIANEQAVILAKRLAPGARIVAFGKPLMRGGWKCDGVVGEGLAA